MLVNCEPSVLDPVFHNRKGFHTTHKHVLLSSARRASLKCLSGFCYSYNYEAKRVG